VSFAAITFCVASQRVIPKVSIYFVMTQSGNFWIHPRMLFMFSSIIQNPEVEKTGSGSFIVT
jgi:hypothetical protein